MPHINKTESAANTEHFCENEAALHTCEAVIPCACVVSGPVYTVMTLRNKRFTGAEFEGLRIHTPVTASENDDYQIPQGCPKPGLLLRVPHADAAPQGSS